MDTVSLDKNGGRGGVSILQTFGLEASQTDGWRTLQHDRLSTRPIHPITLRSVVFR